MTDRQTSLARLNADAQTLSDENIALAADLIHGLTEDDCFSCRVRVGPDDIDSENVGVFVIRKSQTAAAIVPSLLDGLPESTGVSKATEIADRSVRALSVRKAQFESALREWATGVLAWEPIFGALDSKSLINVVVFACENGVDSWLRQWLGSGPLTRWLCGYESMRFLGDPSDRVKLGRALLNLPTTGRPRTIPPMKYLGALVNRYMRDLMPLAEAIRSGHANPLEVYRETNPTLLDFIRTVGVDNDWEKRNWGPFDKKQDKLSARSLAIELVARLFKRTPNYLAHALTGTQVTRRKPQATALQEYPITTSEVTPRPKSRQAQSRRSKPKKK